MSRYFEIHITNGTPICNTYTIYHTSAVPGNEVTLYPSNTPATGITYSQLTSSPPLVVTVPDNATIILLKDTCGNCTPYIDPTPARHFEDAVIEANTLNLLSPDSACDGYGNGCLVSGNGLTFCTSTQFYSIDFQRIISYPTYLIYEGNKLLVTGTIGSLIVNVTSSDNVIAGCTNCDDRPTIFSGIVTTQKSYTFTAQASFPTDLVTTGSYYGSIFQTNPLSIDFDNVGFDNTYFNYNDNGGYKILKIISNQTKEVIIQYNIIFDVSGMVASGSTGPYPNDWQNSWRQRTMFYMAELYRNGSLSPTYFLTANIIGPDNFFVENNSPTSIRLKVNFPLTLNTNILRNAYRFTLSPRVRSVTWNLNGNPPNYVAANEFGEKGPWSPPLGYYPYNNPKYWDNWGTVKILPGSYIKIYDYSQF
jgi:hypothetical protein